MSLRDQLDEVRTSYGRLTPEAVVDAARPHDSPLHGRFEWDDSIAGEAYRRQQAHELIRSVRVAYKEPTATDPAATGRAFHAVREPSGTYRYEPAEAVARDPVLAALVLADMEREWTALHRRWGHFREFVDLVRRSLGEDAA